MNLGGKSGLDALLKDWPSPFLGGEKAVSEQDDERMWEERADATVKAALEKKGAGADLEALLDAPSLPPEAGESGERKMSQDKHEGETPNPPAPAPSVSPPATERKRQSLKEIAARASQSGARPSSPGPRPSSPGTPSPSSVAPGRPSTVTPLPRPVEAGKEDSGVVNLDVVRASVTAQQIAAAEKAQPGQAGLFDDDKTVESAVSPTQPTPAKPANVAVVSAKRGNGGAIAGVAIAVLGIAAAFAIVSRKPPPAAPVAADTRPGAAPVTMGETPKPPAQPGAPTVAPTAAPTTEGTAVAEGAPAGTAEPGKGAEPGRVAVAPTPGSTGAAAAKEGAGDGKVASAAGAPTGSSKPGDLAAEMARAAGAKEGEKPASAGPTPEPAAGGGSKNQNVPEQPSQGSVQAAIGTVMGGAKACVAGADEVSRAQVTFASGGAVTSVTVTGWAAAHGKSACIQAALKGAKVGAFSKQSFSVGVAVRP